MKIEVGQWVRNNNKLIQLSNVERGKIGYMKRLAGCIKVCVSYKDVYEEVIFQYKDVANTPQELVKVGDLVEIIGSNTMFDGITTVKQYFNLHDYITKIYTPNADKTVYTLQWEAK